MSENDKKPLARPLLPKLALATAIVCFLLARFCGEKPPARALFLGLALASVTVCFVLAGFYGEILPARPLIRKLALASAIVCFLLAGFYGFGVIHAPPPAPQQGHNWGAVGLWLWFGVVLVTIGKAGHWPGPKR